MIIEMFVSLILLLFGGYVVYEASTYPDFSKLTAVGSEVFPSIMGWVIIICATILIIRSLYRLLLSKKKDQYRTEEMERFAELKKNLHENRKNIPAAVGIPIMMVLYAVLLRTVGFEILSFLFLLISMLLCHERNILRLIAIPIGGTIVMYYVFRVLLKIMLPTSFF